ncbi:methyltransferase [Mariniphaga sediminis]|uniref:Methyltransferase n=1 Tax=Mariniphaga sediminis TaxID=1628158 RepID=A0A399D1Q1_9BACT|nr:methyltransferase [Mariniphaga sediminis]RIH64611.1 methyltransferase [Mariniphaga sediminis]
MVTNAYKNPNKALLKRYKNTLNFFYQQNINPQSRILDLGVENPFTQIMENEGFSVLNTGEIDLDLKPEMVKGYDVEVVTAFEILEHLVSPFPVLKNLPGKKLIATVPLRLWFSSAYRNPNDPWDCHYHEFEDWQFDWLLEKSGWKIVDREKWKSPVIKVGIRPMLRNITPRYYAVYAER